MAPPSPSRILGRPRHQRQGFRPDIEGQRAIAVLLVMLAHAGVPFVRGGFIGVDVFFVISGFLITGRIRDEFLATGRFSLRRFYAARVERLLPAATVVLYASLIMMLLLLPKIRWRDTAHDLVASVAYFVNWRFADQATDYFASDDAPSIVRHFWSLSVEEQYYIIWPLLLLSVIGAGRLLRWTAGKLWRSLLAGLGIISVLSLVLSIVQTVGSPSTAYFSTLTRLWELGVGSALAIGVMRIKPVSQVAKGPLIWAGLAAIAFSAMFFSGSTGFPGYAALLPVGGTALLLYAGAGRGHAPLPLAWLNSTPMQIVGQLSYSLYLWHWPLLVVFAAQFGNLPVLAGLAVVALSFLPAYLSFRWVEHPIRQRRWLRNSPGNALVAVAVCAVLVVIPALLVSGTTAKPVAIAPEKAALELITNGAAVLGEPPRDDPRGAPVDDVPSVVPDPAGAPDDQPNVNGCFNTGPQTALDRCDFGNRNSNFKVVLIGDSHAAQWLPAIHAVAEARRWHLIVFGKAACPFLETTVLVTNPNRAYTECEIWNKAAREGLAQLKPNLIITTSFRFTVMEKGVALLSTANQAARIRVMRSSWSNLAAAGSRVVVLRDTPLAPFDVADCVSGNRQQMTKCAFDRQVALGGSVGDDQVAAAAGLTGVHLVDLNDAICPTPQCAPVIGGVLIYRDHNHLTATYALSLAPRLAKVLEPIAAS